MKGNKAKNAFGLWKGKEKQIMISNVDSKRNIKRIVKKNERYIKKCHIKGSKKK